MPPTPTWFQGHETLRVWVVRGPLVERWEHRSTRANGQLAVGGSLFDATVGPNLQRPYMTP